MKMGLSGDITIGYAAVINGEQKSLNERVELGDCKDVSKFIEDRSLRDQNLKKSEGKDARRIIDNYKNIKQNENAFIVQFMTINNELKRVSTYDWGYRYTGMSITLMAKPVSEIRFFVNLNEK